jgi:Methyltransferase small domain
MITPIAVFLFAILFWILISIVIWSVRNGISPMPSSKRARAILLAAIPQRFSGTIYELGSGWGTLAVPLAYHFPESKVIALESSPFPYYFSKARCFFYLPKNLHFQRINFFSTNLSDANLVVCYLYPGAMQLLKKKLENELRPGAIVVSNTFAIHGWYPEKIFEINDLYKTKIYFYMR